jgi:hypothetical protein
MFHRKKKAETCLAVICRVSGKKDLWLTTLLELLPQGCRFGMKDAGMREIN